MSYTVLYTSDLANAFSPLATDIPSQGILTTTTVSMPSAQNGFLRIAQQ
jgi:hypothetical protein